MQIICTSLQTDNYASTLSLNFLQLDALAGAQPMVLALTANKILHYNKVPPVLWRCWLGDRKGIRPVKTEW